MPLHALVLMLYFREMLENLWYQEVFQMLQDKHVAM